MTTTTPESRARIAYTAHTIGRYGKPVPLEVPTFDQLDPREREGWMLAAQTLWDLAATGQARL